MLGEFVSCYDFEGGIGSIIWDVQGIDGVQKFFESRGFQVWLYVGIIWQFFFFVIEVEVYYIYNKVYVFQGCSLVGFYRYVYLCNYCFN